jgi:hypothetical protein
LILKYDHSESYCSGLALELCDSIQDSSLSWIGALASSAVVVIYTLKRRFCRKDFLKMKVLDEGDTALMRFL